MNLEQIYNTKQVPRWIRLNENKFIVIHKDKALKIEQKKERFIMNCSEEEFFEIWFKYFDLRTDYMNSNFQIKRLSNKFRIVANRGYGIHILNQDEFEAYVYSKIIEKVGYSKASVAMNHIAKVCGIKHVQSMREAGRVTWFEFPTPEMILEKINNLGKMGKINNWLRRLCLAIVNDEYDFRNSGNELYKLFTKENKTIFPVNDIEDLLERNFNCEPEIFADEYLQEIENKGIVYMYVLHHKLNPPKEMKRYGAY